MKRVSLLLLALNTGCSFYLSHPMPGPQGAAECDPSSVAPAVDVVGGLIMALPVLAGIDVTATAAACSGVDCPELAPHESTKDYAIITAGLLAIDVLYWVAAGRGMKLNNECKLAKAQYAP
jgi:hypothetical protein